MSPSIAWRCGNESAAAARKTTRHHAPPRLRPDDALRFCLAEAAIKGLGGTSPTKPSRFEGEPGHVTLGNPVSRDRPDRRILRLRGSGQLLLGRGEDLLRHLL